MMKKTRTKEEKEGRRTQRRKSNNPNLKGGENSRMNRRYMCSITMRHIVTQTCARMNTRMERFFLRVAHLYDTKFRILQHRDLRFPLALLSCKGMPEVLDDTRLPSSSAVTCISSPTSSAATSINFPCTFRCKGKYPQCQGQAFLLLVSCRDNSVSTARLSTAVAERF